MAVSKVYLRITAVIPTRGSLLGLITVSYRLMSGQDIRPQLQALSK
jgi:hypothetical protein